MEEKKKSVMRHLDGKLVKSVRSEELLKKENKLAWHLTC